MLSFEHKLAVCASFPELERNDVSLGRVNFQFEGSVHDRKNVVYHLHPNGNGFVYAGLLQGYEKDAKGLVNIREFSEDELRGIIAASIRSLSGKADVTKEQEEAHRDIERWTSRDGSALTVIHEEELWYVYAGPHVDMVFESYEEAAEYLAEEGFSLSS